LKKTVEHVSRDRVAIEGSKLRHRSATEVCQQKEEQSGSEEIFLHIGVNVLKGVVRPGSAVLASKFDTGGHRSSEKGWEQKK
jgi:hypothetical protein